MANYLKIEWNNDNDLGDILYADGYKNVMFLDVEVEKPEYNVTLESDLNGDSVEITKFRKWEKVYKFEMWGQEDLVDAFTLMQIHDNITVTLQSGDVIQVAKHGLRADVAWEEIGCLAKITVSFAENYTVAGNCDENMDQGCLCSEDKEDFLYIIDYPSLTGEPDGTIVLAWTVEDVEDKKYTAKLYQFSYAASTWVELTPPEQYTCWNNEAGTYWWKVNFTNGGVGLPPNPGDLVTRVAATANVNLVGDITGSWAADTATGYMYFYNKTGVFVPGVVTYSGGTRHFTIMNDLENYETWIWDGQFWQIFPGWAVVTTPGAGEILVTGWCLPGCYIQLINRKVGGSVTYTYYTADELSAGITIDSLTAGDYEVTLVVMNHTCNYGYTKMEEITVS